MSDLLTREQLAEYLQVPVTFFLRGSGRSIPVIRVGRSIRYRMSDVEAWLDARTDLNGAGR